MTCVFHIFQADVCKKSMELIHILKLKFIAFFGWLSFPVNVKSWSLLSRLSKACLAVTRGVFHRKDSKISVISSILLTQGSQDKSSYKYHLKTTYIRCCLLVQHFVKWHEEPRKVPFLIILSDGCYTQFPVRILPPTSCMLAGVGLAVIGSDLHRGDETMLNFATVC